MAARARSLMSASAGSANRQSTSTELPEYQPAQFTLTPDAQRALGNIANKHKFDQLNHDLREAILKITNSAADVNERIESARARQQRARAKAAAKASSAEASSSRDAEDDVADDAGLAELERTAEEKGKKLEQNLRKMLDVQQSLSWIKDSLAETTDHARQHASTQASLPARSRRRHTSSQDDISDGESNAEEDYPEIEPTAPLGPTQEVIGPSTVFREQYEVCQQRYRDTTMADRYTGNNDYRNFKKMTWAALHPDEDAQAPDPKSWFRERPPAQPGVTETGEEASGDEEDIQMTRAVTSTKCPITLQEFKEPLTSNKCPHTYEASAIRELLQHSTTRVPVEGIRAHVPAVQCPVQGCTSQLTMNDLHEDQLVLRRIRRLQHARDIEESELLDAGPQDGTQRGAVTIDEDGDTGYDIDDIEDDEPPAPSKRVKREMRSSMR